MTRPLRLLCTAILEMAGACTEVRDPFGALFEDETPVISAQPHQEAVIDRAVATFSRER